ncbi:MAG: hypothetical protein RQ930_04315, partial [Candidatus Aenigmarchaeota archaeon]|nr:hypothetical protein [Candidatus Aenigmarchaeota archaeon]
AKAVGVGLELLSNINKSNIKEWVAENVKSLKDLVMLGKATTAAFTGDIQTLKGITTYFEERAREREKKEKKEETTKIASPTIDLSQAKISPLISTPVTTSATTPPIAVPKEEKQQKETIETMQRVRAKFDNLVQRGFFRDNPEYYFHLLSPLLQVMETSPNGKIPSWFFFANWQINHIDESLNLLEWSQSYASELQKLGFSVDASDVLDGMHAKAFDNIYTLYRQGILDFMFPELTLDNVKDPRQRALTESWIASVYRGYKLLKKEPPPEIKVLYHSLTKRGSTAATLEREIYSISLDIQGATGEPIEIETEPEVYTIQTEFLNK